MLIQEELSPFSLAKHATVDIPLCIAFYGIKAVCLMPNHL